MGLTRPLTRGGLTRPLVRSVLGGIGGGGGIPAGLERFAAAIAATKSGVSDTRILTIGDSTAKGSGGSTDTTIPDIKSFSRRLGEIINQKVSFAPGIGNPSIAGQQDQRWSAGAGWDKQAFAFGSYGGEPTSDLTYTPDGDYIYNAFDVYYLVTPTLGTFDAAAIGGSPITVDGKIGASGEVSKTTVTFPAAANPVLTISPNADGGIYIVGVEPYHTGIKRVRSGNVGIPATRSDYWADMGFFNRLQAIQLYAPHLLLIDLSINDAGTNVDPASLQANLIAIIEFVQPFTDIVLMSPTPCSGEPFTTLQSAYQPVFQYLKSTYNLPLVDMYSRYGGVFNAPMMSDDRHPNDAGYLDWAQATYDKVKGSL